MVHEHWQLRESPFGSALNPKYFFASPVHDEALARLLFLVEHRRRFGLLLGPAGTGKTLLFQVLTRQLRRQRAAVASANLLGLDTHELIWQLAADLGVNPSVRWPTFEIWRKLLDRIVENRYQRLTTVLLLDEIHEADPEVLHTVTRLTQCDVSPDGRLTIISAGIGEHIDRLGQRLLDAVELRTALTPWQESDTAAFLAQSIQIAGRDTPLFSREAAVRIHTLSAGVPRAICRLADMAMAAAAGAGQEDITPETIAAVSEELEAIESGG